MSDELLPLDAIDFEATDTAGGELLPLDAIDFEASNVSTPQEDDRGFLDMLGSNTMEALAVTADRIPLVGGYIDNLVDIVSPSAGQALRDANERYRSEESSGYIPRGLDAITGDIATGLMFAPTEAAALAKVPGVQKLASKVPTLAAILSGSIEGAGRDIDDGSIGLMTPLSGALSGGVSKVASSLLPTRGEFIASQLDDASDEVLDSTRRALQMARDRGIDLNAVEASTLNPDNIQWTGKAPETALSARADSLAQTSRTTKDLANRLVDERKLYSDESFKDIVNRRLGGEELGIDEAGRAISERAATVSDSIEDAQQELIDPLFGNLYKSSPSIQSREFLELLEDVPEVQKAYNKALSANPDIIKSQGKLGSNEVATELAVKTRRRIADGIEVAKAKGEGEQARDLTVLLGKIDDAIDEATDGQYTQVNQQASEIFQRFAPQLKGVLSVLQRGTDEFGNKYSGGSAVTSKLRKGLSVGELEQARQLLGDDELVRQAYGASLREGLERGVRNKANNVLGGDVARETEKMRAILGQGTGGALSDDLKVNARIFDLASAIAGGSPTAKREASGRSISSLLNPKAWLDVGSEMVTGGVDKLTGGRNTGLANELTELLLDPQRSDELIQILQKQRNEGSLAALIRALVSSQGSATASREME